MDNNIELRRLGKSDLMVSPVGLGCWQFSQQGNFAGKFWPFLDNSQIDEIVKVGLEGGINWFDTAELYGNGASEKNLARALEANKANPGDVIIATKWWPMFRTAANIPRTIDQRISALFPFPIDLYQVHQPYSFSSEVKEMEAMTGLVRSRKIKYVGVSNFSASKMRNAWSSLEKSGIPLLTNQVRYNLLDRRIESNGILDAAKELGITIIAYSPLAQGVLTGKFHGNPQLLKNIGFRKSMSAFNRKNLEKSRPIVDLLKKLAEKYDATPSQIALNWLIHFNGDVVVVIPGATKTKYAVENAGAMKFRLSEEDLIALDKISRDF
jgi:aryl-alcohol dehydrogenase-like predicted oxidoreductase